MKRHALWFSFAAEIDVAERDDVLRAFIVLGDHLGHVDSFGCGPDVDPDARAAGFGHALVVAFETEDARAAYRALPDYATARARLARVVEGGADGVRISAGADG